MCVCVYAHNVCARVPCVHGTAYPCDSARGKVSKGQRRGVLSSATPHPHPLHARTQGLFQAALGRGTAVVASVQVRGHLHSQIT